MFMSTRRAAEVGAWEFGIHGWEFGIHGGHSLALTTDGALWSWGAGALGQLGHGDEQRQLQPKKIEAFAVLAAALLQGRFRES